MQALPINAFMKLHAEELGCELKIISAPGRKPIEEAFLCESQQTSEQLFVDAKAASPAWTISPADFLWFCFILANTIGYYFSIKQINQKLRAQLEFDKEPDIDNQEKILRIAEERDAKYQLTDKIKQINPEKFEQPFYNGLKDHYTGKPMSVPILCRNGYVYDYKTVGDQFRQKKKIH